MLSVRRTDYGVMWYQYGNTYAGAAPIGSGKSRPRTRQKKFHRNPSAKAHRRHHHHHHRARYRTTRYNPGLPNTTQPRPHSHASLQATPVPTNNVISSCHRRRRRSRGLPRTAPSSFPHRHPHPPSERTKLIAFWNTGQSRPSRLASVARRRGRARQGLLQGRV